MSSQQLQSQPLPTPRSYAHQIATTMKAASQTQAQRDTADAASVASTSSFSSRLSLLKDRLSSRSAPKTDNQEQKGPATQEQVLRNQIRIGI